MALMKRVIAITLGLTSLCAFAQAPANGGGPVHGTAAPAVIAPPAGVAAPATPPMSEFQVNCLKLIGDTVRGVCSSLLATKQPVAQIVSILAARKSQAESRQAQNGVDPTLAPASPYALAPDTGPKLQAADSAFRSEWCNTDAKKAQLCPPSGDWLGAFTSAKNNFASLKAAVTPLMGSGITGSDVVSNQYGHISDSLNAAIQSLEVAQASSQAAVGKPATANTRGSQ